MFKHATICRTKRAQLALASHWESAVSPGPEDSILEALRAAANIDGFALEAARAKANDVNNNNDNNTQDIFSSLTNGHWPPSSQCAPNATSCSSSPTPSLQSTTISRIGSLSSAPSSLFNSPSKSRAPPVAAAKCSSTSTIKVYAQSLGQEVEYLTLPVNAQTQSRHIIRTLLRKFRLKHRDPNLFYLTLERWIRKDGLRQKSVMLLADEACPLQLQQCCSNPPHNDIKFTLQMKAGALVKIFCQDVCPSTKYKCLSLSTQTTVAETIELMLYCLDLVDSAGNKKKDKDTHTPITSSARQANSPDSASSSASSTSSSSGIESDPTSNQTSYNTPLVSQTTPDVRTLKPSSRTGSVASISSASDMFNASGVQPPTDNYCLLIECANTNYKRVLEGDEYLVDVYQNLLDEVQQEPLLPAPGDAKEKNNSLTRSASVLSSRPSAVAHQPDQWFIIKLKRRVELSHQSLKFANPRQNMPLPPIPLSLAQINNADHIHNFVSTTQIEVNHHQHRPSSSLAIISIAAHRAAIAGANSSSATSANGPVAKPAGCHQRHMSAIVNGNSSENKTQPPPARLIWMPQVKPRRRNLTNASSTFSAQPHATVGLACNRRRYDPAQLEEDLNQLNLSSASPDGSVHASTAPSFSETAP